MNSLAHTINEIENIPPPVDSPGRWQYREEFNGFKSFGYFTCSNCEKSWFSAHAFKEYKQGCKNCNRYYLPDYLWENEKNENIDPKNEKLQGPHDTERCEACDQGVCIDKK